MSSVSNSDRAYQSRILNFFNRQWLRFGDRAKTGLRRLQLASIWGIQILAYPLYLLVQTSTVVTKKLQDQAVKHLSPAQEQPTSSVGSQPTAVVLNSLHPWLEGTPYQLLPLAPTRRSLGEKLQFWRKQQPASTQPDLTFRTSPQQQGLLKTLSFLSQKKSTESQPDFIQGIATYLETGKLVLVTTENQAVDLLSETQHEQLKQRMKILLECYEQLQQPWWWRVVSQPDKGRFHPLRWFSQFMIWLQTSSFAKRLNWFQESRLQLASGYEEISQIPPFPRPTGLLNRVDRALSRWENTQLRPVIDKIHHWKRHLDQSNEHNAILSMIRSAVDYFYGVNSHPRLTGDEDGSKRINQSPKLLQPVSRLIQQGKERIGRHFSDRVDRDPFTLQQLIYAAIQYFWGESDSPVMPASTQPEWSREPWLTRGDLFGGNGGSQTLSAMDQENEEFSVAVSRYLTDEYSNSRIRPQINTEPSDSPSDWLQTEAVSMGYEKHILAKMLEALDRALVWLEEKLLPIWKRLKQLIDRYR